jgi:hypothetical protein
MIRAIEAHAHQRHVLAQIHEREMRLGLNPGETKGPCR